MNCAIKGGEAAFWCDHSPSGCQGYDIRVERVIEEDNTLLELAQHNYRPVQTSPCLDAGVGEVEINGEIYSAPKVDFYGRGRPRPDGTTCDIGAVEQGTIVGTNDRIDTKQLTFFPNPATDHVYVQLEKAFRDARVDIIDADGRTITLDRFEVITDELLRVDLSELPPGTYVVRITAHDWIYVHQVVVMR